MAAPSVGHDGAYGDQCEKCGSALSPEELIDPKSTLSGTTPEWKDTTLWYLPMDRHEDWLREYLEQGQLDGKAHHDSKAWKAHVLGQCKSWVDGGLQSRAMTRDLDWGVPVPVEGADGKVLYVWLDAPLGYITATKNWAAKNGVDWEPYWKDQDTQLVHFIGKDNIVFHCIIFPILLKEHGGYLLPHNVPANEFMNLEGDKISTSRNWAVWAKEYVEDFPGRSDEMRYVLASIMPEQKDAEFTWEDFQARVNNELADVLGNFVNRVIVLTGKYFDGKVPAASGQWTETDEALRTDGSDAGCRRRVHRALSVPGCVATRHGLGARRQQIPHRGRALEGHQERRAADGGHPQPRIAGDGQRGHRVGALPAPDGGETVSGTWNLCFAMGCSWGRPRSHGPALGRVADSVRKGDGRTGGGPAF